MGTLDNHIFNNKLTKTFSNTVIICFFSILNLRIVFFSLYIICDLLSSLPVLSVYKGCFLYSEYHMQSDNDIESSKYKCAQLDNYCNPNHNPNLTLTLLLNNTQQ